MSTSKLSSVLQSRNVLEAPVETITSESAVPGSSGAAPHIEPGGLSLRSNFAWILGGNVAYALCQWGVIVSLAKLGNSLMVGQFSLGLAIATPILVFTNLHLRAVQATDGRHVYRFSQYLRLRILLTLVGLTVIAGITFLGRYQPQTTRVILAVALAKGIETISDIHYGLFQLNERLDQSGKSMAFRGILSVTAFSVALYLGLSVLCGCVGIALVWLAVLLFFDSRHATYLTRRFETFRPCATTSGYRNLIFTALPLGLAMTLAALNLNMPRYYIHAHLGERQLGIYSALAYTTVSMILVTDSLGHCAIPRLSRLYRADRLADYRALLLKMLASAGGLGLAGLAAVQIAGSRLLTLVYGKEYAAQVQVFRILILATAVYCVACMFTSAITAARRFRIQPVLYVCVVAVNAAVCAHWIPTAGLAGGAAGMLAAAMVHLILSAAVVTHLLLAPRVSSFAVSAPRDNGQGAL